MEQIMKRNEIISELAKKTGFYKKDIREIVEAYEELILESIATATFDQPSELHLRKGIIIGGKRMPERTARDPRTGGLLTSPEKIIPYATFKRSVREKLFG